MRNEEKKRYAGTPGGLEDDSAIAAKNCDEGPTAGVGGARTATSAATGTKTTVDFAAARLGALGVSGGQHDIEIAASPQSPCMPAQHTFSSGVISLPTTHSTDEAIANASISTPAIGRTTRLRSLPIDLHLT
jgi:hypothetical protein